MTLCIVGWSHTRFGKLQDDDVESLIGKVAVAALEDAGLAPEDVDAVVVGQFNGGFVAQEFPASLVFQALPELRFKPAMRAENACATGSAAIHVGLDWIASGRASVVLVIGVEKMTDLVGPAIGDTLKKASYLKEESDIANGFAGVFARITEAYFQRYGDKSDALARIAAKNHRNGAVNPLAHIQKDLGYDFCRIESDQNPRVAGPLKRTDCSPVSDGAAALVLANVETALQLKKAIAFRAAEQVNDFLPVSSRDIIAFEGPAAAWRRALKTARITINDLSLVETHDCFTIAELLEYEAMGIAAPGEGARVLEEGWTEKTGKLPVNPSGGLKSKGHPIGATGVSMHVMAAMQLLGAAGPMQIPGADLAGVFNMGGTAVANYTSILQRIR